MVSMNVPVAFWSLPKYRAGYAQGEANLSQAKREYANMRNMLLAKAQEALLKAESGAEMARLAKSVLVPQAQQALESNQAAYQGGKGDFMTLLDAYRMRLNAKENAEMAIMQLSASQADLEEAVGLGLDEIALKLSEGAKK
jgi:outer membrane protein TolC